MTAIYHWEGSGATLPKFERRTTICSAADEDSAIATLLQEARDYPDEQMTFLENYCIEEIDEPPGAEPVEVACEMTIGVDPESGKIITPEQFQERYWCKARIPSCDDFGFEHAWHNMDGISSACYNCEVIREGRLWETAREANPAKDLPTNADGQDSKHLS